MKKLILLFWVMLALALPVSASGITNSPELNTAAFWQQNFSNGEETVLGEDQLEKFNKEIVSKSSTVYDLKNYPNIVSGAKIKEFIQAADWLFKESLYVKGNLASDAYKQIIITERDLDAIPQQVAHQYAVTICRVNLRAMPTNEGWFSSAADNHFDQLQETALDPAEPVVILHKSKSGNFVFVQTHNYRGWLPVWTLGLAEKKDWLEYVDPDQFVVITASKVKLKAGGRENIWQMGAKIPVRDLNDKGYIVAIPERNKETGKLVSSQLFLPDDEQKYALGYLEYTRDNVLEQAFLFLGDPYGWGGLQDSVDCSAFIERIYRTVGIGLPRDADEQEETAGVRFELKDMANETREAMFSGIQPGDVLFMPGHTLLYLGKKDGKHYAIHALGSYYENGQRIRAMKVVVSDLDLRVSSGKRHFEVLTNVLSYR